MKWIFRLRIFNTMNRKKKFKIGEKLTLNLDKAGKSIRNDLELL